MKQAYLIVTAGAALLAGTLIVAAQGLQKQAPGGGESRAQGQIQREPGSQSDQKGKQRKGQGNQGTTRQGAGDQPGRRVQGKQETQRQGAGDQQRESGKQGKQSLSKSKEKQGQPKDTRREDGRREGQQVQRDRDGQTPKSQTRDAGRSGSVTLTSEQRTRVRQTVVAKGPRVNNVNFAINVGAVVPRTVRFVPVDPIIVEYYPRYRGYFYFIVGDQIIIVDRRYRIIAVIDI